MKQHLHLGSGRDAASASSPASPSATGKPAPGPSTLQSGLGRDSDADAARPPRPTPKAAKAVVAETTYNFGNMESGTTQRHEFPIRNEGDGAADRQLRLAHLQMHRRSSSTASRSSQALEQCRRAARRRGKVLLEWAAKVAAGPFRHGATFTDQRSRHVAARADRRGRDRRVARRSSPSQLYFGSVHVGQPGKAELVVMAFLEPEVEILSHEVHATSSSPSELKVTVEPRGRGQAARPRGARPAPRSSPRTIPAARSGPFAGSLKLTTNLKQAPDLDVPIYGTVSGDISIFGTGLDRGQRPAAHGPGHDGRQGGSSRLIRHHPRRARRRHGAARRAASTRRS